mgnify:CR=1 FL=1
MAVPPTTFGLDDPALPMNYPGFVFRALRSEGYTAEALLAGTGLTSAQLQSPHFRCGFAPLRRLYLNAIDQTGDPHLALRLAKQFEPTSVGLPVYAAMNAARFRDALDVLKRFFFLTFPVFEFDLVNTDTDHDRGEQAIRLQTKLPLADLAYFAATSALVVCDGVLKAILRADRVTLRAETRVGEPNGWADVSDQIDFPIRFDASEDRLMVPRALLDQPLPTADPINHTRLVSLCEQFASEAAFESTLVSRVMTFLLDERLDAPLAEAAAAVGYSVRSLRRHLERSGTSYRKLVDQARESRAKELLARSTRSIQVIAYDLGFDTPSNFTRSFKRWTGETPSAYRERQKAWPDPGQN